MSTPKSTNTNASTIEAYSSLINQSINQSTSVWINYDDTTTEPTDDESILPPQPAFTHSHNDSIAIDPLIYPKNLIQKRVLFVSLIQLSRSFTKIPSFILDNALFAFGMKRSWLFPQTESEIKEAQTTHIQHFKSNWPPQFIDIIRSKDHKGHILWIEPCTHHMTQWSQVSTQLTKIIDLSVAQLQKNKSQNNSLKIDTDIKEDRPAIMDQSRPSKRDIFVQSNEVLSIAQQILNPSQAHTGFTFTQYTDDETDVSSDSDFDNSVEDHKNEKSVAKEISIGKAAKLFEDKSRPSTHDLFGSISKKIYYSALKLDKDWWINKYEICRKAQMAQTENRYNDLAQFNICCTDSLDILSKFNVYAKDVIAQIECIANAEDFQFGPLKELFFQSNTSLIAMDSFSLDMYVEAHSDSNDRYSELLGYCRKYLQNRHACTDRPQWSHQREDDGHDSDYSISMDILKKSCSSILPFGGRMHNESSTEPLLFDSESNHRNKGKYSKHKPITPSAKPQTSAVTVTQPINDTGMVYVSDDLYGDDEADDNEMSVKNESESMLSNSELPFGGKMRSDLDHLEYYLSNTIINRSQKESSNAQSHISSITSKSSNLRLKVPVLMGKALICEEKLGLDSKRSVQKTVNTNSNNVWGYQPLSAWRAKANIFISKELTNVIIPQRISENVRNVWQFLDKTTAMMRESGECIACANGIKIKIINYGFHDRDSGGVLYCVLRENVERKGNYAWLMNEALYDKHEIKHEFGIVCEKLPISVRESVEYKTALLNGQKIQDLIRNRAYMKGVIAKTKWHKIPIKNAQNKALNKKRVTLSMNKEEFIKRLQNVSVCQCELVPIITFNHRRHRMEFVWVVSIDDKIDIGISFVYTHKSKNNPLQIGSIHLNKQCICNQNELVSYAWHGQKLQCLDGFVSSITNLSIGNPDKNVNKIKDLQKRNTVLKQEKAELRFQNEELKAKNEELQAFKDLCQRLMQKPQIPLTKNTNNNSNLLIPFQSYSSNLILPQIQISNLYTYNVVTMLQNSSDKKNINENSDNNAVPK